MKGTRNVAIGAMLALMVTGCTPRHQADTPAPAPAASSATPSPNNTQHGDAPAGALCHDSTVVTTAVQCASHGGAAEG